MKKHETLAIQNFKFDEQKYSKTMVAKLHTQITRAVIYVTSLSFKEFHKVVTNSWFQADKRYQWCTSLVSGFNKLKKRVSVQNGINIMHTS